MTTKQQLSNALTTVLHPAWPWPLVWRTLIAATLMIGISGISGQAFGQSLLEPVWQYVVGGSIPPQQSVLQVVSPGTRATPLIPQIPSPFWPQGGIQPNPPSLQDAAQAYAGMMQTSLAAQQPMLSAAVSAWVTIWSMFMMMFWAMWLGSIAISVLVCWLLYKCLDAVPPPFRKQESGLAFLLLIPLFNIVWIFFVFLPLARGYQEYFARRGRTDVGDSGYGISKAACICTVLSLIPLLGIIPGLIGFVLFIMVLVKAWKLKGLIEADQAVAGGSPSVPTVNFAMATASVAVPRQSPPPPPNRSGNLQPPPMRPVRPAGMPPPPPVARGTAAAQTLEFRAGSGAAVFSPAQSPMPGGLRWVSPGKTAGQTLAGRGTTTSVARGQVALTPGQTVTAIPGIVSKKRVIAMAVIAAIIALSVVLPWDVISESVIGISTTTTVLGFYFWQAGVCTALGALVLACAIVMLSTGIATTATKALKWACMSGFAVAAVVAILGMLLPARTSYSFPSRYSAAMRTERQYANMFPTALRSRIDATVNTYSPKLSVVPIAPIGVAVLAAVGVVLAAVECRST